MAYTKLDSSIILSSVWREPLETKVVWITLLALKDINGEVRASVPGLAHAAGVSIESCEVALVTLLAPDPYSGSPEEDGRRITPIQKGWHIVNHKLYQGLDSDEDRKKKAAERQKRYRDSAASRNVTVTKPLLQIPHADADADADADAETKTEEKEMKEKECSPPAAPPSPPAPPHPSSAKSKRMGTLEQLQEYAVERGLPASDGEFMFDHNEARGWTLPSTGKPLKCWKAHFRTYQSKEYLPSQKGGQPQGTKGQPPRKNSTGNYLDKKNDYYEAVAEKREGYDARSEQIRKDKENLVNSETPEERAAALEEFNKMKRKLVSNIGNI